MKIKNILFIAIIGMMGATAFGTTTKLEEKQKPTFTQCENITLNAVVNVDYDYHCTLSNDDVQFSETIGFQSMAVNFVSISYITPVTDVGWHPWYNCNYEKTKDIYIEKNSYEVPENPSLFAGKKTPLIQ